MIARRRRKEERSKHLQRRQKNYKSNEPTTMDRGSIQQSRAAEQHSAPMPQRDSLAGLRGSVAMEVLARRLDHIEHAARKVARLAARPVIEDV